MAWSATLGVAHFKAYVWSGRMSIPEQYSQNVPFESSPVCALAIMLPVVGRGISVIKLREMMMIPMILYLHRQGRSVSAIARQAGINRNTVGKVHRARAGGSSQ